MIKVLSQNVMCWGEDKQSPENRTEALLDVIDKNAPDVIGFQEVTPKWMSAFDRTLTDYLHYLIYRSESNLESTPIYWNPKTVRLLDCGHFWLSETPDTPSKGWDAACYRVTHWGLFEELATGKTFAFVNTHLDHKGALARVNGIKQIVAFINDTFGADTPLVLTGDFNATPDSETIKTADSLLVNTMEKLPDGTYPKTFHGFGKYDPITIDYVYASKNMTIVRSEIVKSVQNDTLQSDHFGVFSMLNV